MEGGKSQELSNLGGYKNFDGKRAYKRWLPPHLTLEVKDNTLKPLRM